MKETPMSKLLAVLVASFFAVGTFAADAPAVEKKEAKVEAKAEKKEAKAEKTAAKKEAKADKKAAKKEAKAEKKEEKAEAKK